MISDMGNTSSHISVYKVCSSNIYRGQSTSDKQISRQTQVRTTDGCSRKPRGRNSCKSTHSRVNISTSKRRNKQITNRTVLISDRFLKIWNFPEINIEIETSEDEVNIFDAEPPTNYRKLSYAVFLGEKIETKDVTKLYVEVFKRLFLLQPESFFETELGEKIGLSKQSEIGNLKQPEQLNDIYYIEKNIGSNQYKFDRIKQALTIFDFEDELSIRYAD